MRKWALCFILAGIALPAFAANRVTVEQVERVLSSAKSKPDSELAKQLSGLELTERLSTARLEQFEARLSGEKSEQALLALADTSAFLDPPSTEMPATATPDRTTQQRILSLTVNYLGKSLPLLPNLFAARDTMRFETRPSQFQGELSEANPLREVTKSRVTVLYRDGREFVDAGADKDNKAQTPDKGLTTWGEFGPILGTVVIDAARSRLSWSHWELGGGGPQAVFQYSVPKEKSHYEVRFCCVAESYGFQISVLTQKVGYHGQITVDPDSGTILRLTVLADLDPGNPISQADVAVEYGPVEIGGKTYFCPVKGIALSQSPDLKALHSALTPPPSAGAVGSPATLQKASLSSISQSPKERLLNDVAFRQFHIFRSDAKVVTANEAEAVAHAPTSPIPSASNNSSTDTAKPANENAVEASSLAPQPDAEPVTGVAPLPGLPPEPVIPEITVSGATGVPDAPAINQAGASGPAVTLRLTARLVDVSLVALDKKGRPITNLKPEDFEIYDNGQKVNLRSFTQLGSAAAPSAAAPGQPSAAALGQPAYSNRYVSPLKSGTGDAQGNTIVLLLDTNLSFDDLTNAREQMVRFIQNLQSNERVGLFAMKVGTIRVIQEPTTDHALLAATLAKFRPSAQSISLANEQEERNRQSMEYVAKPSDLVTVNGLSEVDSQSNLTPLDARLKTLGDHPGQSALEGLVDVARHLAAVPGHKSLVWIASDNVLADWNNSALNIDKGDRFINADSLRTQEAMNNAHVSVYPLDASRLEAGGIDASIGTRNVEVNPAGIPPDPRITAATAGPEMSSGLDVNVDQSRALQPGRAFAQMHQDEHAIQGAYRELADATGGHVFRRASDIIGELNGVAADGRATYLLSFTPAQAADGKYHLITVKLPGRKDVNLRYRTGYLYRQEPATFKERFREAAMQPEDATEIALTADPVPLTDGHTVKLGIAATDLEIAQTDAFWTDKLDVYVVQREVSGTKARVTGQSMGLRLQPATYQKYLQEGIPFNQVLEVAPGVGSVRIVVVDENSGRMGSVTVPAVAIAAKP